MNLLEDKKLEDIYDQDIHPLVERITLICKQAGMPMFCTFQDDTDSFRTSCLNGHMSSFNRIKMLMWINETWDFDEFMKKVICDARQHGHASLYLKAMGIPEAPPEIITKGRSGG